jgi:predicted metal-dependent HD superfamily phosphohydrolase
MLGGMAILIDHPIWPAHGTVFAHLVSDTSLAELHAFAAAADIPERAFDEDHYDVPERRHADLVRRGAVPVDGRTLARALIASGLRIPARERAKALAIPLAQRWDQLLPGRAELGRELVGRWSEPHRRYHTGAHLFAVLASLETIADGGAAPRVVDLAAWFHDAVYTGSSPATGTPQSDEEQSALLAEARLRDAGLAPKEVAEVARLVRLTAEHRPGTDDGGGQLLCDADLSILGRDPARYRRYTAQVRAEYAHVPDDLFRTGRAAVLEHLLALDPLFHTERGQSLWLERAHRNLRAELALLRDEPTSERR